MKLGQILFGCLIGPAAGAWFMSCWLRDAQGYKLRPSCDFHVVAVTPSPSGLLTAKTVETACSIGIGGDTLQTFISL